MSENLCRQIDLETRVEGQTKTRCKRFGEECPECACETFSFGNGSPGPVKQDEKLVRFHFSPRDIGPDGKPTPFAFSEVDDVGLSVTRNQATDEQIKIAIENRLNRLAANQDWHSVSMIDAKRITEIQRIQDNQKPERCFCVYDTADSSNIMHAEIMQTKAGRKKRLALRNAFVGVSRTEFRNSKINPKRYPQASSGAT